MPPERGGYVFIFNRNRIYIKLFRPRGKESTKVRKSEIKGKESENSYQELKRSQKDRHTQTHGNCIKIFRLARPSFSIVPVEISGYSLCVPDLL